VIAYSLCDETAVNYDSKINETHLQECLKRLLVLYASYDNASVNRRAEFIAYYLLVNLGEAEALTLGLEYRNELGFAKVL